MVIIGNGFDLDLELKTRYKDFMLSQIFENYREKSITETTCFSETNLLYMKNFYLLYQPYLTITPQVGEQITQQVAEQFHGIAFTQQLVEQIKQDLFSVPWGHHML